MNTPGGRPPAKLWRFLALGAVNWRSCFLTGFFGRHFVFRTKNQRGWSFSTLCLKNKSLPLPGHLDRLKMVHVDSQIKDSSNSLRRRHSSEGVDAKFGSTLPKDFAGEVVFDWIFWSLWIGNFHDGLDYGYARICLKNQRGRVEMTFKQSFASARTFRQPNQRFFQ